MKGMYHGTLWFYLCYCTWCPNGRRSMKLCVLLWHRVLLGELRGREAVSATFRACLIALWVISLPSSVSMMSVDEEGYSGKGECCSRWCHWAFSISPHLRSLWPGICEGMALQGLCMTFISLSIFINKCFNKDWYNSPIHTYQYSFQHFYSIFALTPSH